MTNKNFDQLPLHSPEGANFRIGGTGQPPATIWLSQVGKENIFSSCQVLQARCENQPCSPRGAHGTTKDR